MTGVSGAASLNWWASASAFSSSGRIGSSLNFPYEAACSSVKNSTGMDLTPMTSAAGQGSSTEPCRRADRLC
jgi:hypothetical protein